MLESGKLSTTSGPYRSGDTAESDPAHALQRYEDAEQYIYGLIMGPPTPQVGTSAAEIRQRATARMGRLRAFLEYIGNPQQQFKSIHIAGTSGKGSTASMAASVLMSADYRTGLHVSPYLQVATEKLMIDGRIASAQRYFDVVTGLASRVESWQQQGRDPLTYGEFWVALAFEYFASEHVDYAVIEVGAGGRFDLTNVIEPEIAAITSVGLDHTVTLGSTIPEIAWHKAGILKREAKGVTTVADAAALDVIQQEADQLGVNLQRVTEGETFSDIETTQSGTTFRDAATKRQFRTRLPGTFQAANAALALAIGRLVGIADDDIAAGLEQARFPGRMEVVQDKPLVMLDGAHNPQKIGGLIENLGLLFAERRLILVCGVLESKEYREMIVALKPYAEILIATSPEVYAKPAVSAADIAATGQGGFQRIEIEPQPLEALQLALEIAGPEDVVLVTGSLYLVGNIREHWYPTNMILTQGTMWPDRSDL